jgi:uncharacterized protein (TIGR03435 family)
LVTLAYRIAFYQLSAPDWSGMTRFDLRATVPEGATKEQLPLMLQNLVADRCKLAVHHETSEIQRYELVVAKGGPKFKEASQAAKKYDSPPAEPTFPPKLDKDGCPVVSPRGGGMFTPTKAHIHYPEMTMDLLVIRLSGQGTGR